MRLHGQIVYDGDGNRVSETAGGVTTTCLVDTLNPTGYSQVLDELVAGVVQKTYTYGLQRISEKQLASGKWTPTDLPPKSVHVRIRQLSAAPSPV